MISIDIIFRLLSIPWSQKKGTLCSEDYRNNFVFLRLIDKNIQAISTERGKRGSSTCSMCVLSSRLRNVFKRE